MKIQDGRTGSFDESAHSWDDNPRRVKLARDVASFIQRNNLIHPEMKLLDFGCGTGLLSYFLYRNCSHITGMDSSQGMLDRFQAKVKEDRISNIDLIKFDPEKENGTLNLQFDMIVSTMTIHHIENLALLFSRFYDYLTPGGSIALADLDKEDGSFHSDRHSAIHHGFNRDELGSIVRASGFNRVQFHDVTKIEKKMERPEGGEILKKFPVFLLTALR